MKINGWKSTFPLCKGKLPGWCYVCFRDCILPKLSTKKLCCITPLVVGIMTYTCYSLKPYRLTYRDVSLCFFNVFFWGHFPSIHINPLPTSTGGWCSNDIWRLTFVKTSSTLGREWPWPRGKTEDNPVDNKPMVKFQCLGFWLLL